jgi:hypothetical protein
MGDPDQYFRKQREPVVLTADLGRKGWKTGSFGAKVPVGVPVASIQETTIRRLRAKIVEKNEGLLPQMSQMRITDSFHI